MFQEKHEEQRNLSQEEKNRKCQNAHEWYRKFFIENEHSGEEKHQKCQYACNLYNNLSKEKNNKRCEYARQNIETFPKKKKIRSINMIANDIEIILK